MDTDEQNSKSSGNKYDYQQSQYGHVSEDEYFFECVFDNAHVDTTLNIALLLPK